jgi:hypothetical protein
MDIAALSQTDSVAAKSQRRCFFLSFLPSFFLSFAHLMGCLLRPPADQAVHGQLHRSLLRTRTQTIADNKNKMKKSFEEVFEKKNCEI